MMLLPSDTQNSDWLRENLKMWSNTDILQLTDKDEQGNDFSIRLVPLEAKALHVLGLLVRTFDAAGHMLYFGKCGPVGDFYLHSYLLACTAIELLARCKRGHKKLTCKSNEALKEGFRIIGLERVHTNNDEDYDLDKLVALRNLAAHGQGVASVEGRSIQVFLHVELLDHFPKHLMRAFDDYYDELFKSSNPEIRKKLAASGVEPVLYSKKSGQVYIAPIEYAYKRIYKPQRSPSQALEYGDWQVYNPAKKGRMTCAS